MNAIDTGNRNGEQYEQTASDQIAYSIGSRALSSAGLTTGTTTNTSVRVNATTVFTNGGILYSKAAAEVAFPVSGTTAFTGANDVPASALATGTYNERVYQICINAAGTLSIVAGVLATAQAFTTGALIGIALIPNYPLYTSGLTPLGYVRITIAPNGTTTPAGFEANTTALGTSGFQTCQYFNGYPMPFFYEAQ